MSPKTERTGQLPGLAGGLALFLLLCATPLSAMEALEIEADYQDVDGLEGVAVYEGNVEIRHKDLVINADRMVVYELAPGVFDRAIMTGEPVTLVATPEDGTPSEGQARQIEYHFQSEHLIMEGSARLKQPRQDLRAERIEYTLPSERVRAMRGEEDQGRVRVRFEAEGEGEENGS